MFVSGCILIKLLFLQGTVGCIVDTGLLPVSRQLPHPFKWVVWHNLCLSSFDKTSNTLTEHFRSTGLGNYPESIEEVVFILVFDIDYPNRVKLIKCPRSHRAPPIHHFTSGFLFSSFCRWNFELFLQTFASTRQRLVGNKTFRRLFSTRPAEFGRLAKAGWWLLLVR